MAEEIIFGDITTGASNDIKRATETARSMVMKYGMSEKIGLIAYGNDDDEVFIELNDGHSPALLKCNVPFLYVLMPLRIS